MNRFRSFPPAASGRWPCLLFASLVAAGPGDGLAAATAPAVRAEIDALMAALRASGCEFQRNGGWHDAPTAAGHLMRKLDAVEQRTTLASAERFIELAATRSSVSGTAYQVRCPGVAVTDSATWLTTQLRAIRAARAAAASPPPAPASPPAAR